MMAKKAAASRRNGAAESDRTGMGTGNGGETHQVASEADRLLTTNQGVPISDNQNSLKSGARGPALLEDFVLREKITHFDHERIP
jgi:catalase